MTKLWGFLRYCLTSFTGRELERTEMKQLRINSFLKANETGIPIKS